MASKSVVLALRNFLGVNRRDGADLVQNNEFFRLQNFYPKTKGMLYKREGSTQDLGPSDIPMCSEITGLYRYTDPLGQRSTLYYCKPSSQTIASPDVADFTLLGIGAANSGNMRTGVNTIWATYVGRGNESAPVLLSSPNLPDNTRSYSISYLGQLPTGVQSANIYVIESGFPGVMRFAGVLGGSYGTGLTIRHRYATLSSGGVIAKPTWNGFTSGVQYGNGGTLKAGTYYVSAAWLHADPEFIDLATAPMTGPGGTNEVLMVVAERDEANIHIEMLNAAGNDGTAEANRWLAIFVGLRPPTEAAMQFAGIIRCYDNSTSPTPAEDYEKLDIYNLFTGSNAQSAPKEFAAIPTSGSTLASFDPKLRSAWFSGSTYLDETYYDVDLPKPFLVKQDQDGNLTEILFSGSGIRNIFFNPFTAATESADKATHALSLLTGGSDPMIVSYVGMAFIANGVNLLLQTDGYAMYDLVVDKDTTQAGIPVSLAILKNQLIVTVLANKLGTRVQNQVYGSNSLSPYNWATGGSGPDLKFATIGDGFADGVTALGLFSFNSAVDGPNAFVVCAKKASIWLLSNVPDPTTGVPASANAISNRTGCIAQFTMIPTNIGLMFLGNDGDVYLISGTGGEPRRIGNRIRPMLEHLAENEDLMKRATACFHKGFYKLSYPSSSESLSNDAELWADLRTEQQAPITWSGPHIGTNVGKQIVFLGEGDEDERLGTFELTPLTVFLNDEATFQDLGDPIVSVAEWKTSRFGTELNLKRYFGMFFDLFYDTQFDAEVSVEGFADAQYSQQNKILSDGSAVWDSDNFDQSNWGDAQFFPLNVAFGPTNLVGRTFRWKLTHSNDSQLIMASAHIIGKPEKRRIV